MTIINRVEKRRSQVPHLEPSIIYLQSHTPKKSLGYHSHVPQACSGDTELQSIFSRFLADKNLAEIFSNDKYNALEDWWSKAFWLQFLEPGGQVSLFSATPSKLMMNQECVCEGTHFIDVNLTRITKDCSIQCEVLLKCTRSLALCFNLFRTTYSQTNSSPPCVCFSRIDKIDFIPCNDWQRMLTLLVSQALGHKASRNEVVYMRVEFPDA